MSSPKVVNRCLICDCVAEDGLCPECKENYGIKAVENVEASPVQPLVSREDMEFFAMYDHYEYNKFYKRLLKALGDSHEGRELTDDLVREFFKDFIQSGLTFHEWFEQQCWS